MALTSRPGIRGVDHTLLSRRPHEGLILGGHEAAIAHVRGLPCIEGPVRSDMSQRLARKSQFGLLGGAERDQEILSQSPVPALDKVEPRVQVRLDVLQPLVDFESRIV